MAVRNVVERAAKTRELVGAFAHRARARGRGVTPRAAVAAALDELGRGWQRIDDIQWPNRSFPDIGHVLVGPSGVFVIDSRELSSDISLERAEKGSGQTSVVDGLEMAAHAVGSLLGMTRNRPTPVLCFVGEAPIVSRVGDVVVVTAANIAEFLRDQPVVADSAQVSVLAGLLRQRLIPATGLGAVPSQRAR